MLEAELSDKRKTDLWLVEIEKEISLCRANYLHLLSPAELEKSYRFKKTSDSDRYVVTRVIVRLILSGYVDLKPENLQFLTNQAGKPELAAGPYFNVSHAGKFVVLACSPASVGIDIEFINPEFDYQDIVTNCFNLNEQHIIDNDQNPRRAFYYAWTRKEAIIKKDGLGMSDNLTLVNISLSNGLINLDIDPVHVLALAYDDTYPPAQIKSFTLS